MAVEILTGMIHTPFQGDLKLHVEEKGDTGTDAAGIFLGVMTQHELMAMSGNLVRTKHKEIDANSISPV